MSSRSCLAAAPVVAAGVVVAGVRFGERLGPGPGLGCGLAAGLALASAVAVLRSGKRGAVRALGLLGLGLLAAASMQRALDGLDGPLARLARSGPEVVVSARLAEDPRPRGLWGVRVLVRVTAVDTQPGPGSPRVGRGTVVVVARAGVASRLRLLSAGEWVALSGRLRPLAGAERRLRWRHAVARLEADDLQAAGPVRSPILRLANGLRALVLRGSGALPDPERALVAGFLVGDDRGLPPAVAADFRSAGLSHLLAVSGANVALALALAGPTLRRLGLAGRLAGGLCVLGLFAAMTRFEPSVLRASVMAGLSLLAGFLGHPTSGLRVLALAVAGLVLLDPFLVHSVGFALSCGASAGIVLLAGPIAARLPAPRFARESLAVTAAAQLGVAPVALPAFGSLPLVALPANLATAPAAAALTVWGLGSGLAGGLLDTAASGLLQAPTGALAAYIWGVASLAARFPAAVEPRQAWGLLALAALALAVRCGRGPRPPALAPGGAAGRGRGSPAR